MRRIGNLERLSDSENPNWIPRVGEYYAWRESNTRHGNLIIGQVLSYDAEKRIVRGCQLGGMTERRHLSGIFRLPEAEAM